MESSVKNIKVVDNKAVDDWDNGTVFEVTDSDDTVPSNTNDNSGSNSEDEIDASSAMYMSLFLCKTFSCNFAGYENNFDFNIKNILLNWNNDTLSRVVEVLTHTSNDANSLNDNIEVNRILNKYAMRANGAIRNSTSVRVSCAFDTIDANLIKLDGKRCIVKVILCQALLTHAKLQNGNEHTLSCIQDFSIVDTSILGMKTCQPGPVHLKCYQLIRYYAKMIWLTQ